MKDEKLHLGKAARHMAREGFNKYMADLLLKSIGQAIKEFKKISPEPTELFHPFSSGHLC